MPTNFMAVALQTFTPLFDPLEELCRYSLRGSPGKRRSSSSQEDRSSVRQEICAAALNDRARARCRQWIYSSLIILWWPIHGAGIHFKRKFSRSGEDNRRNKGDLIIRIVLQPSEELRNAVDLIIVTTVGK
jgi:hypothetical protein